MTRTVSSPILGMMTTPTTATTTTTTPPTTSIPKSTAVRILVGVACVLLLLSVTMFQILEDLRRDDDTFLLPGMSNGMMSGHHPRWTLRQERKRLKRQRKQQQQGDGALDDGGKSFFAMEKTPQSRGGGNNLQVAITKFAERRAQEQQQRAQQGTLTVREAFEQQHNYDTLQDDIQHLRQPIPPPPPDLPYNIHQCPLEPPPHYPFAWNVLDVLENWNPDNATVPQQPYIYQGLCVFDWNTVEDRAKMDHYRQLQVPFVTHNFPQVLQAAKRWTTPQYLQNLLGKEKIRNEHSHNNHFMYWKTRFPLPNFKPPTDMVDSTFDEWQQRALRLDILSADQQDQTQLEHWYFRLNGMLEKHGYLYEELPFFDPSNGKSLTMIEPLEHRGINCRFGMKGVIAETHFDSSSNFIAVMGGQRRYILAHPDQCINMELYPADHPSGRHSSINWSTAAKEFRNSKSDRPFTKARVNEVVLQAGDLMYLPTFWFHFIVSLSLNYQCNSRSGESYEYEHFINECGFRNPKRRIRRS